MIENSAALRVGAGGQGDAVLTWTCVLTRARLISRVITAIYDDALRPFGIGSTQFAFLVNIFEIEPATRAEIGRYHHQNRSTLTRNLKIILSEGWAEEVQDERRSRGRPIVLTKAGKDLLRKGAPAWRKRRRRFCWAKTVRSRLRTSPTAS